MNYRVLSYNIHKGFPIWGVGSTLKDLKVALIDLNLDLVFLQEVQGWHENLKNHHGIEFESQLEFLADQIWPHSSYAKNAIYPNRHHGNAILSRYPILSSSNYDLTLNRFEMRGLQSASLQLPKSTLQVFNTHLNLMESDRHQQFDRIRKIVLDQTTDLKTPFLLSGDFNDWTMKIHQKCKTELSCYEVSETLNGKCGKTFPALFPILGLDRLYFSKIQPRTARVLTQPKWQRLSDHLPLLAEFEIDEEEG